MRINSLALPGLAAIVVAGGALALSNSRSTPSAAAVVVLGGKSAHLTIANYAFAPAALTVKAGTKITVTNHDQTAHTATASTGFDSGTLKPGQSAHFTLTKPGTYRYICQFHAFMTGTITVVK